MKIEEILRNKGHDVVTITESQSVLDAVQVLVDHNIGGLVVTEGEHPTGILTTDRPGHGRTDALRGRQRDDLLTRVLLGAGNPSRPGRAVPGPPRAPSVPRRKTLSGPV